MATRLENDLKRGQKQADAWNERYPPGTPVRYYPAVGDTPIETRTRSAAWILGHGSPVVSVEGRAGGVFLDHVEVIG